MLIFTTSYFLTSPSARSLNFLSAEYRKFIEMAVAALGDCFQLFPSKVLGFEVDAINSVQFSNHTGNV